LDEAILIAVVLASIFGISYVLARCLHKARNRLIERVVRGVERATKWRIYSRYILPRLRYKILDRYYFQKR